MKAISTLTVLPVTKTNIARFVDMVKDDILEGYINPLETAKLLKSFEEIVKQLRDDAAIKEYILDEAEKYKEKTIDFDGCKIQKRDAVRYDYSGCGDTELDQLKSQGKLISEQIKARENWLKSLKDVTHDPGTGEEVHPPLQRRTSTISVTLKK